MMTGGEVVVLLQMATAVLNLANSLYKSTPPPKGEVGLADDLNFMKKEFEMMLSFLADEAERRGHQSSTARTWVRLVRDLAYDVEDYFQELVIHLEKPLRSPSNPVQRKLVVDKIRGLREMMKQCKFIKDLYCGPASSTDVAHDLHNMFTIMPVTFASKQELFIGRETEKSHIIKIVTNDDKSRQIIPIWGMGGLGKTALARSIYENKDIISKFQKSAWVTLPHLFNEAELFRSLVLQLQEADITHKETLKKMELQELIEEANRHLRAGSHLIVIDNVFSIAKWKFLMQYLPEEENASRIIVTTREKTVAEHCSVHNIYKLEALSYDAALELFVKTLMKPGNFEGQSEMVKEAKCILQKCNGLPLAITTIGGFLASRPKTAPEWKRFNEHFSYELEKNPSLEMIRTVLTSNCEDLPYHLKLCFLYLSIFPEDQKIRRRRLVRRWIAEGYSSGTHNMNADESGESYFSDLINRSIVQPSESVAGFGPSTDYCHVHNLLHEISVSKSREERFSFVLHNRSSIRAEDTIRHLSIKSCWNRDEGDLKSIGDLSRLRSLTVFGKWESFLLQENMKMLRVLDLEGSYGLKGDHLEQIANLLHLKYLSLRGCDDIYYLPDSLGNLWDLQTLDVRGTNIILFPSSILKLRNIQYLRVGKIPKDEQRSDPTGDPVKQDDEMAATLMKLTVKWTLGTTLFAATCVQPQIFDNGSSRKDAFNFYCKHYFHALAWGLDMHGVEVPNGIGNLSSLETLGVVNVGARNTTADELGNLSKLRKLGVTGLKKENSQQFFSAITNLTLLVSLSIRSEGKPGLQDCLDGKSSLPPPDLRSLKLYGNLVTLPPWISRLQNLAKLKLRSTRLGQDAIPVLGRLPHLAILRLLCYSIQGEGLHFHFQRGSFPNLVLLQLDGLPDLQSLKFEQGTTPNLELLQVENCTNIGKQGWSGLSFLPSLKEVSLKAGHEYGNKFIQDLRWQLAVNQNRSILNEN